MQTTIIAIFLRIDYLNILDYSYGMTTKSSPKKSALNIKISPHIKAAFEAKRPTGWFVAIILVIISIIGFGYAGGELFKALFGAAADGSAKAQLSEAFVFAASILFIFLWVKFKEQRNFRTIGFLGKDGLKRYGIGFLIGIALIVVPTLVLILLGDYTQVERAGATLGMSALWIVIGLFFVWAIQSTSEEIIMRGFLLQSTGRQLPAWFAVIIPSLLFAALHIGADPIALLNIVLVALFFSFLSLGQGSIWMAAGIHTAWNMTQGSILGIPVSNIPKTVSIWAFGPTEGAPQWLTGGSFGIEASVAGTVVLASAMIWSYFYYRRNQDAWEMKKVKLSTTQQATK